MPDLLYNKKSVRPAGRPDGTSKYKEKTVPIRVPLTLVRYVEGMLESYVKNDFKVKVLNRQGIIKIICKKVPEPHLPTN